MATTTKQASKAAPQAVGPETVGSVSAVELSELRARTRTIGEIGALRDLYSRMLSIATNERVAYQRELLGKHSIEGGEDFAIDEQTGAILKYPSE